MLLMLIFKLESIRFVCFFLLSKYTLHGSSVLVVTAHFFVFIIICYIQFLSFLIFWAVHLFYTFLRWLIVEVGQCDLSKFILSIWVKTIPCLHFEISQENGHNTEIAWAQKTMNRNRHICMCHMADKCDDIATKAHQNDDLHMKWDSELQPQQEVFI